MSTAALRLDGVAKRYRNGVVALDGIDLVVARAEFVSLLGPSGCGKSTLLRLLAGLARPSQGTISWPGAGASGPDLGLVPQEPTLMPWRRVFDNVRLPLQLDGQRRRHSAPAVMAALDAMGLSPAAQAFPRQLSGGMRMRVSIARALVGDPQVLLMDEPFAALDEVTRNRLNDDLLALAARRGLTILFVTHSVTEAVYLSSRVVVMQAGPGRIAADLPVALPSPRHEAMRLQPDYLAACAAVSAALRAASA